MSNYRFLEPVNPDPNIIAEAAKAIRGGGIIIFPTQCLYGIGADAFNTDAIQRIYTLKRRSPDKPILILVSDRSIVADLIQSLPAVAHKIMDHFWPGNITLVLNAASVLPDSLTAFTGKIGIREVGHPVPRAITSAVKGPITGTSANWAGHRGVCSISELPSQILEEVDLILDSGELKGGVGSTVVDVTQSPHQILREGKVSARQILAALQ